MPNFVNQQILGGSSDFDGDNAVVVSYGDGDGLTTLGAGGVWMLGKGDAGIWTQTRVIQSNVEEQLGWAVAIRGETVVLGAPGYQGRAVFDDFLNEIWFGRGRATVMEKDGSGSWIPQATLSPGAADWNAGFGAALDIAECGCLIAVGAWNDRERRGSVYVFSKTQNGSWTQVQKLAPTFSMMSESALYHGNYGYSVSITNDLLAVKAAYDSIDGIRGVVYVYQKGSHGLYEEIERLSAPEGTQVIRHPSDMSFLEGHLIVGAAGNNKVYVFERTSSGGYRKTAELTGSEVRPSGTFGISVDGEGTEVMVGDGNANLSYLFSFEGEAWIEKAKFAGPLAALSGDSILAHSPDSFGLDEGLSSYKGEVGFYDLICDWQIGALFS